MILLLGCGTPQGTAPGAAPPAAKTPATRPLAQVFVLEAAGAQPDDTVVALTSGAPRVIVLRRSAPDFGLFARLELGDSTLRAAAGAAADAGLTLRPRPGEFALDLEVRGTLHEGGSILFSYGAHFVAPAGARERYGSDLRFEQELTIGRLEPNGDVVFLPTRRPGSDMLEAPLAGPGRYLVVAPR
ncbi:MAG TPA: hypothetical protein VL241_02635 [Gemmatimonadales bacterium]|nr:hypothetical protein [Gemmatimonadales bacterium]